MGHDDVGANLDKLAGLLGVEGVGSGEQVQLVGQTDAVDFPGEAHSRLFQAEAKIPIDQADGREVLDPGKAQRTQLGQEDFGNQERIGRADAGQNRSALDGGQDLVRPFP